VPREDEVREGRGQRLKRQLSGSPKGLLLIPRRGSLRSRARHPCASRPFAPPPETLERTEDILADHEPRDERKTVPVLRSNVLIADDDSG